MKEIIIISVFFALSLAFLVGAVTLAVLQYRRQHLERKIAIKPLWILIVGVFLAAVAMFYPVYSLTYFPAEDKLVYVKSVWLSVHNTMRLFILDGEYDAVKDLFAASKLYPSAAAFFSFYACVLYVLAPVLTAGFVLSLFKSAASLARYAIVSDRDTYYLSQLNVRSLALAEDIVNSEPKTRKLIIFLDVNLDDEENSELISHAKRLGALCLSSEITDVKIKKSKKAKLKKFYFIDDDEDINLEQALVTLEKCRKDEQLNTPNTCFFVFSRSAASESLLNSADNGNIRVRRVDESRNLIFNTLLAHSIFADAVVDEKGEKRLNIVIIGMGRYGTELMKALCWCGQMVGYTLTIHIFDKDSEVENRVRGFAPELIARNGVYEDGDAYYNIVFHGGIDVESVTFSDELTQIGNVTTAYSFLGDDEANLKTAIRMREIFGRLHISKGYSIPPVFAAVAGHEKTETIRDNGGIKSLIGEAYGIHLIGDTKVQFSVEVIEQRDLEERGLKCHLRWANTGDETDEQRRLFERYEYYRRTSVAEALYSALRVELGIVTGTGVVDDELIFLYEHRRWAAYLRTEGYIYAPTRDSIAKTHPSLVPYSQLSQREKKKDAEVLAASETK